MAKESKIMNEIHKVREKFYRQTRGKNREYILKLIKEGSDEVIQELDNVKSDPELIQKEKYPILRLDSTEKISQIRERKGEYGKRCAKKGYQ